MFAWKRIEAGHYTDQDERFVIQHITSRPHGCRWVLTDIESDDGEIFDAPRMTDCKTAAVEIMSHPGTCPSLSAHGLDDFWTVGISRREGVDIRGTHFAPGDQVAWSPFDGTVSIELGLDRQEHWSALVQARRVVAELLERLDDERARAPLYDSALLDRIEHLQSTGVGRIADTLSDTLIHATATRRAAVGPIQAWADVTGTIYEAGAADRRFGVRVDLPQDVDADSLMTLVRMAIAQAIDDPEAFAPPEEIQDAGTIQGCGDAKHRRLRQARRQREAARAVSGPGDISHGRPVHQRRRSGGPLGALSALSAGRQASETSGRNLSARDRYFRQALKCRADRPGGSGSGPAGRPAVVQRVDDCSDRIARRLRHPDHLVHQASSILRAAWGDRVPHSLLGGGMSTELIYEIWDDILMDDAPFRAVAGGLDAESLVEEACEQYKFTASFLHQS